MRKLILIAVFLTMSSSVCHANLSLASNEPPQQSIEQPGLRAVEARAEAKAEAKAEAPPAITRSANVSKPRPRYQSVPAFLVRRSFGHCL